MPAAPDFYLVVPPDTSFAAHLREFRDESVVMRPGAADAVILVGSRRVRTERFPAGGSLQFACIPKSRAGISACFPNFSGDGTVPTAWMTDGDGPRIYPLRRTASLLQRSQKAYDIGEELRREAVWGDGVKHIDALRARLRSLTFEDVQKIGEMEPVAAWARSGSRIDYPFSPVAHYPPLNIQLGFQPRVTRPYPAPEPPAMRSMDFFEQDSRMRNVGLLTTFNPELDLANGERYSAMVVVEATEHMMLIAAAHPNPREDRQFAAEYARITHALRVVLDEPLPGDDVWLDEVEVRRAEAAGRYSHARPVARRAAVAPDLDVARADALDRAEKQVEVLFNVVHAHSRIISGERELEQLSGDPSNRRNAQARCLVQLAEIVGAGEDMPAIGMLGREAACELQRTDGESVYGRDVVMAANAIYDFLDGIDKKELIDSRALDARLVPQLERLKGATSSFMPPEYTWEL